MITSETYRLRARACTHAAYGTNDPYGREALLELAEQWMQTADAIDKAVPIPGTQLSGVAGSVDIACI
jgi:hypothetical protein